VIRRAGLLRKDDFKRFKDLLDSGILTDDEDAIVPENIVSAANKHPFLLKYMCQNPAEAVESTNLHKAKQLIRCIGLKDDIPAYCFDAKSKNYVPFNSLYSSSSEYREIRAIKYIKSALKFVSKKRIYQLLREPHTRMNLEKI